jgi:hypothetical protein
VVGGGAAGSPMTATTIGGGGFGHWEAAHESKQQRRAEIYALNKLMKEYREAGGVNLYKYQGASAMSSDEDNDDDAVGKSKKKVKCMKRGKKKGKDGAEDKNKDAGQDMQGSKQIVEQAEKEKHSVDKTPKKNQERQGIKESHNELPRNETQAKDPKATQETGLDSAVTKEGQPDTLAQRDADIGASASAAARSLHSV